MSEASKIKAAQEVQMKYKITIALSGRNPSVEISFDEYSRIKESKHNLFIIVDIEDKLDLLLENYADYERSLLELALQHMLFRVKDWQSGRANIHIVNRRLINLLSAARLYIDQVKHDVGMLYGQNSELVKALNTQLSQEYDAILGYRVMEEIRNYIQHRSLPVHRMSYSSKVERPSEPSRKIRYSVVPSLDTARLEVDGKFKSTIAQELKAKGDSVPLTPLVREYVEALGRVHETLREGSSKDTARWEAVLAEVETKAFNAFNCNLDHLAVVTEDEDGSWPEIEHIFNDLWKYRKSLVQKNSILNHLSERYISSASEERNA